MTRTIIHVDDNYDNSYQSESEGTLDEETSLLCLPEGVFLKFFEPYFEKK